MRSRPQLFIGSLVLTVGFVAGYLLWGRAPAELVAAVPPAPVRIAAESAAPAADADDPAPSPTARHFTMGSESTVQDFGFEEPKMR